MKLAIVAHIFNPSLWEAEAGKNLSSSRPAKATQGDLVSKKERRKKFQTTKTKTKLGRFTARVDLKTYHKSLIIEPM